ncbi:hypothetical protein Vafri_3019 [Volvox africanus]|uniref:Transmembrane protein 19 n=1 Tax=Volvox africanus TaxID=51714 RepID=A0A8J4AQM6_9CHLO|nr:hypothetical protein Vafri_3019 [Volvox africanus]
MEAAAGAQMRPCSTRVGQRCRYPVHQASLSPKLVRRFQKPWISASTSGPGPTGGPPSSDVNESLAPIFYRFGDGAGTLPAAGTSKGHGSVPVAKWSNIVSTGNSGVVNGTGIGASAAGALSSSAAFLDSNPRIINNGSSTGSSGTGSNALVPGPLSRGSQGIAASTSGSSVTITTTTASDASAPQAPPHGTDASEGHASLSRSYSEYYRQANTSFPRPLADSGTAHISNGSIPSPNRFDGATAEEKTTASYKNGAQSPPAPTVNSSDPAEVTAALARAHAALERAESSLDDIQRLSSSLDAAALKSMRAVRPPGRWAQLLAAARGAAALGVMVLAMLASHAFGLAVQWIGAAAGAAAISGWGLRRGSLAPSGAAAAFMVGFGTLGSSLRLGATLVAFFLSASKLTIYKAELKEGLDENVKGGQRTWVQVLCNGLVPTILAVVYGILAGCVDLPLGPAVAAASGHALEPWRAAALTGLMGGFLGYYACCCGDTWASELGPLSADTPRLITTLRPVQRGTNGGVTLLGLSASIMGGMFVGLVFYLAGLLSPTLWIFESQRSVAAGQWRLIPLGLMAGLFGSALDSLLGATLQYSGYNTLQGRVVSRPGADVVHISGMQLLDNNAVNAVSASLTAVLTALVALKSFGF